MCSSPGVCQSIGALGDCHGRCCNRADRAWHAARKIPGDPPNRVRRHGGDLSGARVRHPGLREVRRPQAHPSAIRREPRADPDVPAGGAAGGDLSITPTSPRSTTSASRAALTSSPWSTCTARTCAGSCAGCRARAAMPLEHAHPHRRSTPPRGCTSRTRRRRPDGQLAGDRASRPVAVEHRRHLRRAA